MEEVCLGARDGARGGVRLSATAFRLRSRNVNEIALHRLRQAIKKGVLYWTRIEDDAFHRTVTDGA